MVQIGTHGSAQSLFFVSVRTDSRLFTTQTNLQLCEKKKHTSPLSISILASQKSSKLTYKQYTQLHKLIVVLAADTFHLAEQCQPR